MQTSDAGLLERDQIHYSFIISVASTLEYTRRSRPRNFELDLSFEVIITDTRCKEAAIGARGNPMIHPIEPGKLAGNSVNRVSRWQNPNYGRGPLGS